jgi:16S rRNA (guanine966-N2)-methyltransferase
MGPLHSLGIRPASRSYFVFRTILLARHRKAASKPRDQSPLAGQREPGLRIIGGSMRGRKLFYSEQERTRPMKDRVREAVFNLVGPAVAGKHAVDLFAGTGALGLEAISRGALRATFIEQHFPTAALIRKNAAALNIVDRCRVEAANAFIWLQNQTPDSDTPWLAFCSPPYAFYVERQAEMLSMIQTLLERVPQGSILVVESDKQFDIGLLPAAEEWDIRHYPPAMVAIFRR